MPFEQLVQNLELQRDLSRNPLFQVSFALQNMPVEPLALAGIQVERLPMDKDSTPFDWTVLVWDDQRALRVHWAYNAGLFSRERMQSAIANFQTLLELIVTQPDLPIDRLNLVNEADRRSEIVEWNATQHPYPRELPLAQLFEAQVEKDSQRPGVALQSGRMDLRRAEPIRQPPGAQPARPGRPAGRPGGGLPGALCPHGCSVPGDPQGGRGLFTARPGLPK